MKKIGRLLPALAALTLFLALIFQAKTAQEGAREGLTLAVRTAVPALFPFFVASALLTATGVTAALGRVCGGLLWRLYGLPGSAAAALVLGLTGGYPVGAASAAALYREGQLTRVQAEHLLGFCNNTGPAFVVGVCGAGLLGSVKTGLTLYAIHVLAALLTGLALTGSPEKGTRPPRAPAVSAAREPLAAVFVRAVQDSFFICIKVTAFITIFAVLCAVLRTFGVFSLLAAACSPLCALLGLPADAAAPLVTGALELTNGLALLPELHLSARLLLPLISALLAFGGFSVWCQSMSVVSGSGLSLRRCFVGKTLHAAIAAAIASIWCAAAPRSVPVFAADALIAAPLPVWMCVLPPVIFLLTFTYGKHRRHPL